MRGDYSNLNLKDNPFVDLTPLLDQEEADRLIWAGLPSLKQTLEEIHRQALTTTPRQIILNWGTVGAGKTYAAYYFSSEHRLKSLVPEYEGNTFWFCVNMPKGGNSATQELFHNVIDGGLSLSQVKSQIALRIAEVGKENLLKFLARRIRSEEFAKAILLLGDEDAEMANMMSRYLYGSATNTDLKKMGLARPLKSTGGFAKVLAGILLCFVGTPGGQEGRLFLWLDETEDMLFFTIKQYRLFAQFLRVLIDHISEGVTVFLNSTLEEPDQNTIRTLFGEALWSRINDQVRFHELSVPDGMLYCQELLRPFQLGDLGIYFPFTEEALCLLLEMIPQDLMIPQEINKRCSEVLNFALKSNKTAISKDVISTYFSQREALE